MGSLLPNSVDKKKVAKKTKKKKLADCKNVSVACFLFVVRLNEIFIIVLPWNDLQREMVEILADS